MGKSWKYNSSDSMYMKSIQLEVARTSGVAKAGPGRAWLGRHMPSQSIMFIPFMSCNLAWSTHECKANGLVYSRCPVNTNDLATPRVKTLLLSSFLTALGEGKLSTAISQVLIVSGVPWRTFIQIWEGIIIVSCCSTLHLGTDIIPCGDATHDL